MPSLKERNEDIPLLIEHFIKKFNAYYGRSVKGITEDALNSLVQYNWKGNVRELENVIERAINLMEGNMITIANLPDHILERYETRGKTPTLRGMEKTHILNVLKETGGDRAKGSRNPRNRQDDSLEENQKVLYRLTTIAICNLNRNLQSFKINVFRNHELHFAPA